LQTFCRKRVSTMFSLSNPMTIMTMIVGDEWLEKEESGVTGSIRLWKILDKCESCASFQENLESLLLSVWVLLPLFLGCFAFGYT
jgi:hypothetical protein